MTLRMLFIMVIKPMVSRTGEVMPGKMHNHKWEQEEQEVDPGTVKLLIHKRKS